MRKSIIQKEYCCKVCGTTHNLHSHEVFFGKANRKKSIQDKMVVYLCGYHHNLSDKGIHFDEDLNLKTKREAQLVWEQTYGDRVQFIKRYGKSYL